MMFNVVMHCDDCGNFGHRHCAFGKRPGQLGGGPSVPVVQTGRAASAASSVKSSPIATLGGVVGPGATSIGGRSGGTSSVSCPGSVGEVRTGGATVGSDDGEVPGPKDSGRSGWVPDRPEVTGCARDEALCFFAFHWGLKVKPLSLWQVDGLSGSEPYHDIWASCQVAEGSGYVLVSVAVLGKLVRYMTYRPRTVATPLLLQTKAAQVMKELGFNDVQASLVISGSVAVAHLVTEPERAGWKSIQGAWRGIVRWTDWFRRGFLADNRMVNWATGGILTCAAGAWLWAAFATIFPGPASVVLGLLGVALAYLGLVPVVGWMIPLVLFGLLLLWRTRPRDRVALSAV